MAILLAVERYRENFKLLGYFQYADYNQDYNIIHVRASAINYKILTSTRDKISSGNINPPNDGIVCFTDGSLCDLYFVLWNS